MSDAWKILLTPDFQREILEIHRYIETVLLAPQTASRLVSRILDAVKSLENLPLRFELYEKEPWKSRGLRKMAVEHFAIFYLPNDSTQEVVIFHIFYAGRNFEDLLGVDEN